MSIPTTKKGVYCSIIRGTCSDSERCIHPESCQKTTNYKWQSSSTINDMNDFAPIYAANNANTTLILNRYGLRRTEEGKKILNAIITERRKALPADVNYLSGIHNHINTERARINILPLYRESQLDDLATKQAKIMAAQRCPVHSTLNALISELFESGPFRKIGENVCRGVSAKSIHKKMMKNAKNESDKNNVLDRRFSSFGVGTAPDVDGVLYICQLFKG